MMKKIDQHLNTKIPRAVIRFGALNSDVTVIGQTTDGKLHNITLPLPVAEPGPWGRRLRQEYDATKAGIAREVCQLLGITSRKKAVAHA